LTDSVAKHLQDLRVRAGDPSYREIERLIARQGRPNPMARSTIQEKISGRSRATASQVFSLVEALAEHARLHQIKLSPQEIDQAVWQSRVTKSASTKNRVPRPTNDAKSSDSLSRSWDISPLRYAGMTDLVEMVESSEGAPLASWLPHIVSEMHKARMSCSVLLEQAAKESPHDIVQTLAELERIFPLPVKNPHDPWSGYSASNEASAQLLLRFAARHQGVAKTPVIVVAMRRSGVGNYVDYYLSYAACWHLAPRLEVIVDRLRSAKLEDDARTLLRCVGSDRVEHRVVEVVEHFHKKGATSALSRPSAGSKRSKIRKN
jgi:hypothetical protein